MTRSQQAFEAGGAPPPRIISGPPARKAAGFRLPLEHGAWWTFFTAWAFSAALAWRMGLPWLPALMLLAAQAMLFLASDWLAVFFALGIKGHSAGHGSPWAWQGWILAGPALLALGCLLAALPSPTRPAFLRILTIFSGLGFLVMILRITLPPRHLLLLVMSSGLLSAPWALMAALQGSALKGLAAWWPLGAYVAATPVFVQAWLRGASWPAWRRDLPVFIFALGAGVLAWQGKGLAAGILLLMAARMAWRLAGAQKASRGQAPQPQAVRALGFEQAFWSIAYCAALLSAAP